MILSTFLAATSLTLAIRTGKENCWVRFDHTPTEHTCITHAAWIDWLNNSHSSHSNTRKKWRESSPPQNAPNRTSKKPAWKTETLQKFREKRPLLVKTIERIRENTSKSLVNHDRFGVLRSLILNEKSDDSVALLRKLGFVHLASATGIHLYSLFSSNALVARNICRIFTIPIKIGMRTSKTISFFTGFFVWILSGARMGMLRPILIILFRKLGKVSGFHWTRGSPLFMALILDSLATPGNGGRIVYALAIGGGILGHSSSTNPHWGMAMGSWLFVGIWEAWEKGTLALATPLISLITLPLICFGIYPLLVFCLILLSLGQDFFAIPVLELMSHGFSKFIEKSATLALYPGNLWVIPRGSVLIGSSAALACFCWKGGKSRKPFILLAAAILSLRVFLLHSIESESTQPSVASSVEQLDVGQGDAALIGSENPQWIWGLVDTGSFKGLSESAWMEIFAQRQIQEIQWIALTHLDEDHCGALLKLAQLIRIRCIVTSPLEVNSPKGHSFQRKLAERGLAMESWRSDCFPFPSFSLSPGSGNSKKRTGNDFMSAVWIPLEKGGFYLSAGDAHAKDEIQIGNWAARQEKQNPRNGTPRILKISHHGSSSSSTQEFLTLIQPTEAWISSGRGNSYGHPSVQTLNRLRAMKTPSRRTDQEGAIRTKDARHRQ